MSPPSAGAASTRRPRWRALALIALAGLAYSAAAWAVPPGFYDGFAPPPQYNWLSPPPQFQSGNQAPNAGHTTLKADADGRVEPGLVSTLDAQAMISFVPGAFSPASGNAPVSLDIKPVGTFPKPAGVTFETNVYCVTSNSTIAPGQMVLVTLRYSSGVPSPANVYELPGGSSAAAAWQKLPSSNTAAPFMVSAHTSRLGCFAGGFPTGAVETGGGFPVLPVILVTVVVLVLLAGLPIALMRRQS